MHVHRCSKIYLTEAKKKLLAVTTCCMCRRFGLILNTNFGSSSGPIWLDNLRCTGNEDSLVECSYSDWGVHNCDHDEDVSIVCGNGLYNYSVYYDFLLTRTREVVKVLR